MSDDSFARSYDVVVVGGGTAGLAASARLAELGAHVCVIEAGPSDLVDPRVHDIRQWQQVLGSNLDWSVRSESPYEHVTYSAGRVLGGSSTLNNVWAFELPDFDLDLWADAGLTGWSPDELALERGSVLSRVAPAPVADGHSASQAFLDAVEQAGFGRTPLGRTTLHSGGGWVPLAAHGQVRKSAADVYLNDQRRGMSGITVITSTLAERVVINSHGRATGVHTDRGTISGSNVVLAAGALNTPRLLMLSGIGPREQLERHGVPVLVDRSDVGRHLQDHPLVGVTWSAAQSADDAQSHGWETALLMSESVTDEPFDLMVLFSAYAAPMRASTRVGQGFTIAAYLARPRSRGSVHLAGSAAHGALLVHAPLLTDESDHQAMVKALDVARLLGAQDSLRPWLGDELEPKNSGGQGVGRTVPSVRGDVGTMFHPVGTCRMGGDDESVVTPDLRVRGVEGVWVSDASVLPHITTVPPYLTCLTIGERCARMVAAQASA